MGLVIDCQCNQPLCARLLVISELRSFLEISAEDTLFSTSVVENKHGTIINKILQFTKG